jgi:hypothetical protein
MPKPETNGHTFRDPWSDPGLRIGLQEEEPDLEPTEDPEGATRPADPAEPQPGPWTEPPRYPPPHSQGQPAPQDPAAMARRAALAGLSREEALDLAAKVAGLAPACLPDPESLRRAQAYRQTQERALAETDQRLADLPTLPILGGLAALGLCGLGLGVYFDANAIAPAYAELDHAPHIQLALSSAAVSGAILFAHLGLTAGTPRARWGFGGLTVLLLGGSALIRALYGTPLGLSLLGMPVTTTQGPLTLLSQTFNALAATAGSVALGTAAVTLLAKVGPQLAAHARLRRNRSALKARLEDHGQRTQAAASEAAAEAARGARILAQAELAYREGCLEAQAASRL